MDIEDYFQAKNDNIAGVKCPILEKYPDGYIDSPKLPMALTWVMTTKTDEQGLKATSFLQVDVFVQSMGQGFLSANKVICKTLRDLFIVEYAINAGNMWVSNNPPVRILPGSVEFGSFREVVMAPDETPYYGFVFTLQTEVDINDICD